MTHDDTTADTVSGPGGTPPGPSPARPGSADEVPRAEAAPSGVTAPVPGDDSPLPTGEAPDPAAATLPPELAEAARALFGDRLDLAAAYAEVLATDGVVRGLIGPREAPRIWDRHLLNCAAVAERIPPDASVLDVGSGAGLPGLVLAIARPDLTVTLVEPLARRTSFLVEVVEELGLAKTVRVFRGRAEEAATGSTGVGPFSADVVTARAVAPLDRLAAWCLPLTVRGGRLVAMKGVSAAEEIAEHAEAVAKLGGGEPSVQLCGVGVIEPPATVVEIVRERVVNQPRVKSAAKRSRGGRRRGR
ncbi:16S rRNA (guanine(527)-N(7))-methyltransferase RsmG [Micromonospora carbonacea]|uniref:Ribosomal RNA small subunit methyltransferase G n=1 Tax=Micromonospora carbonacea TaxID=47853 RepID=A0A1C5ARI6_9ACTN|nr:16S rRNA m(7)G-527 methyltransferase [Micromonospora carbonacea]